ncbi:N-acetyltransferase family protein [Undibacterium sp. Jales W-56]|uniref:arsinothricin resistance N-acetyltransferase ArsN1 family B n=1 Tax=Undibacterium sp. Jales W-56 TaxID=2897325 RepID=UPI0021CE25C0|nr:arsinothricin resistance N-acetyltransferase ArsN1 family B [Undibacterium sp. Jales W-56]MCU6432570.1 N-acetyltransferase family protein [Undibacterium sp. Jales W-56]
MLPGLRMVDLADAEAICRIYNYYVVNTTISFEEEEVSVTEMTRRISEVSNDYPWLVLERDGMLIGYAYASKWKPRSAYRFSVECSVYLSNDALGQGAGTLLYESLFEQLRKLGVHTLIGGIALPNAASVALHEKLGFSKVAHFSQIGFKKDGWVDVAYWQKTL